jgi:hypothetical protein
VIIRPLSRRQLRCLLATLVPFWGIIGEAKAQSAAQLVQQGRQELAKQSPGSLRNADRFFTRALQRNPDHEAANVLRTGTVLAMLNRNRATILSLDRLGIRTISPSIYDPEYAIAFDNRERIVPARTATTKVVSDWTRNTGLREIDAALGRLGKVRNKNFLLVLRRAETGSTPLRIDYGDVHGVRFLLLMAKAAQALDDSFDTNASFYAVYEMLRRGELDLETFLKRYPVLLTRARPDRREASKRFFLAAERAYRTASPVIRQRDPRRQLEHVLSFDNRRQEREFRDGLATLARSFATPQTLEGVRVNLGRAITTPRTPRSLLGRVRGNSVLPGTWPDRTLGGVLPQASQAFLQRQADAIAKSLNASYPDPRITSAGRANGQVGRAFRYQIRADLKPRSFRTSPLPPGLTLRRGGIIAGTPKAAGSYSVRITANTHAGPASRVVTLVITR